MSPTCPHLLLLLSLTAQLQHQAVTQTAREAQQYLVRLGHADRKIGVAAIPDVEMDQDLGPDYLAYTTRGRFLESAPDQDACLLHFRRSQLRQPLVIAHESCHCALDWDVMNAVGYSSAMTTETERLVREHEVSECADRLTKGR